MKIGAWVFFPVETAKYTKRKFLLGVYLLHTNPLHLQAFNTNDAQGQLHTNNACIVKQRTFRPITRKRIINSTNQKRYI